jgi:hypothetical protein
MIKPSQPTTRRLVINRYVRGPYLVPTTTSFLHFEQENNYAY